MIDIGVAKPLRFRLGDLKGASVLIQYNGKEDQQRNSSDADACEKKLDFSLNRLNISVPPVSTAHM